MNPTNPAPGPLGFDPETIRLRYRAERLKRQLGAMVTRTPVVGLGEVAADPFAEPIDRPPVADEVDAVVIGGGFAGLVTAAQLRKAGVAQVRVIERAGGFGGVWYWNRYPGIRCDIDAYSYLPMLEDVGTIPSQKYADGEEIRMHCAALARTFELDTTALLQTQVSGLRWDQDGSRWIVTTGRGDRIRARFVCISNGTLDMPSIPEVEGLATFGGRVFHSSRWDFEYTGGNSHGGLDKLTGKRVVVVGTAASAIQFIPHLADYADHVTVVQRTPVIVMGRENPPTDLDWFTHQPEGWQQQRQQTFTALTQGPPGQPVPDNNLGDDATVNLFRWTRNPPPNVIAALGEVEPAQRMLIVNYWAMEKIRADMAAVIDDPETAEEIKPYYNLGCKRPQFSSTYLQTFNRPNVTLLDTQGRGLDRMTAGAVVVGGVEHEADLVIFATGFAATAGASRAEAFPVIGRGEVTLSAKWADGTRPLHGIMTSDFPNLFVVGDVAQSAFTFNFTHLIAEQARYVSTIVGRCLGEGVSSVEPSREAEARWAEHLDSRTGAVPRIDLGCPPDEVMKLIRAGYPGPPLEYMRICREWLDDGAERDLVIERAATAAP